jgi:ubiquinone/menaquinone biosynthesis C-methylase UbiE
MSRQLRVNYDDIAHLYDAQPYRDRLADPELLAFAAERHIADPAVLDIGCGTGNQLIANRGALPRARYIGLDRSFGMLRQARIKMPNIPWVRGDGAVLPFPAAVFDFVCCQFAFHHLEDKAGMLRAVFQVLRPGGRFSVRNMCPQESHDWLYYEYFPEARLVDLRDFWPPDTVVGTMEAAGFVKLAVAYEHLHFDQNLPAWLEVIRRRDTCSQLQAISDAAYRAGVKRLRRDIADPDLPRSRNDQLCLVTIRGDAPAVAPVVSA